MLGQASGGFTFNTAASGTAGGTITYTQAMTLDSSGNLGVGVTNMPAKVNVQNTTNNAYCFAMRQPDQNNSGNTAGWFWGCDNTGSTYWAYDNNSSRSNKMTLTGNGDLGVGTSSPNYRLSVYGASGDLFNLQTSVGMGTAGEAIGIIFTQNTNVAVAKIQALTTSNSNIGLTFSTYSTGLNEAMRITSTGQVGIGTTGIDSKLVVSFDPSSMTGLKFTVASGTFTYDYVFFQNSGGNKIGSISSNNSTVAYNTSSDYRLKNTILPMTGALAKVSALKPVTYKWNADDSDGEGFIAHELAEVVPQCVTGEKDAVDEDGKPKYQGVDTSFLVATLTAAIQELKAEVDALKSQINQGV
jgi:hypothetical protein